jgi:Ca-activated chloride channel family protein
MKRLFLGFSLFFMLSSCLLAQYTFKGIIVDETNNEPLIGANVMIKGSVIGTVTDIDGKFELETKDSICTLVVNYTGFSGKELTTNNKKPLKIALGEGVQLSEVVVTGYGIKRRLMGRVRGLFSSKKKNKALQATSRFPIPPQSNQDFYANYNTEDYGLITENRFLSSNKNPLSTFSIDVDAASYSNLRRFIQNGQQPPKDAVRIEEMINYFNYNYPEPKGEDPVEIITEMAACPWNADHRLVHIGLQAKKIDTKDLPPSNFVFLVDVSGSMQAANKLPLLQASLNLLVNQLRPSDRVAIVSYAGAAGLVLPSTSGENAQKIKEAIYRLEAGGSTAGAAGIQLAYKIAKEHFIKEGNNRVILATDGDFNVGVSSDAALVRLIEKERNSDVFLTVMGFGMGNYKDNKMQELANKGNGNHAYIDNINEAKKVLVNEFGASLFTVAKDVKLQIEFNPAKVQSYRLIGYENRMLEAEDFNDDKKDAGELGAGHTVTALYEIIPVGTESEYIAKVDDLKYQDFIPKNGKSNSEELLHIKLRYKAPKGNKSKLIQKGVPDNQMNLNKTSSNFRFAAAVAEFGLLLRDSEFKQEANYEQAIKLAKEAKGADKNGYRAELIRLMETVSLLSTELVTNK